KSSPKIQKFSLPEFRFTVLIRPARALRRGRLRDRHGTLARVAMDAVASGDLFTGRNVRSVRRSRVVLAPRPWRQVGASYRADDGGKKRRSPGRARISRKTIARGKPGCPGCTCSLTRVLSFATFAHGTAGAVGAWLSLRPLIQRDNGLAKSGQFMSRKR